MTPHQQQQLQVIAAIEAQANGDAMSFSTVTPVSDYENDNRICFTSVHFPHAELVNKILAEITEPLRALQPDQYYYPAHSLHQTIKNIRTIAEPPNFTEVDVATAKTVFAEVVPRHHAFQVYFYRLLLFPNSLALIGTTDPELDELVLDLDAQLTAAGVPDNKIYANSQYFFCNMTLARFIETPSAAFKNKVAALSAQLQFDPYLIDTVTLLTCNAALLKQQQVGTWELQK